MEHIKRTELNQNTKLYHDELVMQQEEKNRQNKLQKLNEQVAATEHTKKWNDWV